MSSESTPLLKAATQIMSGRATAKALKSEASQLQGQAGSIDLQSVQSSERRREDFAATMAAIVANRAARGLSLDTPTGVAVEHELRRQAVRDEGVERLGYRNQAAALRAAAAAKRRGGSNANLMGYLDAGGSLIDAGANAVGARSGKIAGYGKSTWGGSTLPNSAFKW